MWRVVNCPEIWGKFHLCSLRAATDGMQETQKLLNTSWNTQNEDKIIKKTTTIKKHL